MKPGAPIPAWLFDGRDATRHDVTLLVRDDGLELQRPGHAPEPVGWGELEAKDSRAAARVFGRRGHDGWRLGIDAPLPPEAERRLPRVSGYGGIIDRVGLGPALAVGLALTAVVLFIGYRAPDWIAPLVPPSWESRLGAALVGDFGGEACGGAAGGAALGRLVRRIAPDAAPIDVRVVDIDMVNAAALPGRHVVIFGKLIDEAESPDELAGVLAHEIGHVEHRDSLRALIRQLGIGALLGMVGGNTGAQADALLSMRYSRGAEREADAYSIAALGRAGISPLPTARFFERLAKQEQALGRLADVAAYVSSHPMSAERRRAFAESAKGRSDFTPALSPAEWTALKGICDS